MKKLVFILGFIGILGCNNVSDNNSITVEFTPNPEVKTELLYNVTTKILKLDLINQNVTYLTKEVDVESVNEVISDIEEFNSKNNKPIYLIIDTPGGNVVDGGRLISVMQSSKNPIYAIDTGLAASMGS